MELFTLENLRRLDDNLRRLIRENSEEEYDPEFSAFSVKPEKYDEIVIANLPRNCRERDILEFLESKQIRVMGPIRLFYREGRAIVPVLEKFRALRILDRSYFDQKKINVY